MNLCVSIFTYLGEREREREREREGSDDVNVFALFAQRPQYNFRQNNIITCG